MSKGWLEELVHEKYGLLPTDKAQQAIIEINNRIKQLEVKLESYKNVKIIEAHSKTTKDVEAKNQRLTEAIEEANKKIEANDPYYPTLHFVRDILQKALKGSQSDTLRKQEGL